MTMVNLIKEKCGYNLPNPDIWLYNHYKNDFGCHSFRVKEITNEEKAKEWIQEFSDINKVTWRVQQTFPNVGRIHIFKLILRCHHKTDKRFRKNIKPSKNTDCPAELSVVIRRYVEKSKAKEVDVLIKDYPGIVTLKHEHNHVLESASVLKYRDLDPKIEEKFKKMFMEGHDSASVFNLHKIDLMLEHQDMYHKVVIDGKYMPSSRSVVSRIFEKTFKKDFGSKSGGKIFEHLQNYLNQYENTTGGKAQICRSLCGEHYFVVLCTPLMLRVHEKIKQSSELVLLEASGGVHKQKHRIYFLVTPSAAGALPLGVIICDCEKENVFSEALQLYKVLLGNAAFFNKKEPNVFMTDNNLKEINALNINFSNSCILLCQLHMLRNMWSWLCDPKHNIHENHRQEAYFFFKRLLYSFNEQKMEGHFQCFKSFSTRNNYEKLTYYIDHIYTYKEKWVTCFRHNLSLQSNITNYVDVAFGVLKDCLLKRVKAFNLFQFVDFVLTRYELCMKQRLTDFCNGKYSNSLLKSVLPDKFNRSKVEEMNVIEITENNYTVTDTDKDNQVFCVEIDKRYCSCSVEVWGKLCEHAAAVILSFKENIESAFSVVCVETKHDIFYVAEGTLPPSDWLCSSQDLPCLQLQLQTNLKDEQSDLEWEDVQSQLESSWQDSPCSTAMHDNRNCDSINSEIKSCGDSLTLSEERKKQLQDLFNRISNGVEKNPSAFVPAVEKLIKNANIYAKTDSGLLSAMHTFGYYTAFKESKRFSKRRKKS